MNKNDCKLSLARIFYPVTTLGPGKRVGIWLNGCNKRCKGCISPELRQYDASKELCVDEIMERIEQIPGEIEGFTISGGEPFLKPSALNKLVQKLMDINDDILIYTGYTMDELYDMENDDIHSVISLCAALIAGPYEESLDDNKGIRGSSNQQCLIYKYPEKYQGIEQMERKVQTIVYHGNLLMLGIPQGDGK